MKNSFVIYGLLMFILLTQLSSASSLEDMDKIALEKNHRQQVELDKDSRWKNSYCPRHYRLSPALSSLLKDNKFIDKARISRLHNRADGMETYEGVAAFRNPSSYQDGLLLPSYIRLHPITSLEYYNQVSEITDKQLIDPELKRTHLLNNHFCGIYDATGHMVLTPRVVEMLALAGQHRPVNGILMSKNRGIFRSTHTKEEAEDIVEYLQKATGKSVPGKYLSSDFTPSTEELTAGDKKELQLQKEASLKYKNEYCPTHYRLSHELDRLITQNKIGKIKNLHFYDLPRGGSTSLSPEQTTIALSKNYQHNHPASYREFYAEVDALCIRGTNDPARFRDSLYTDASYDRDVKFCPIFSYTGKVIIKPKDFRSLCSFADMVNH